ncbi:MAG: hypothetical protein ABSB88_06930 [Bryobacteraceae bacterium]|jgi:hypothetical protein
MAGYLDVKVCWYQYLLVNPAAILEQPIHKQIRVCLRFRGGAHRANPGIAGNRVRAAAAAVLFKQIGSLIKS